MFAMQHTSGCGDCTHNHVDNLDQYSTLGMNTCCPHKIPDSQCWICNHSLHGTQHRSWTGGGTPGLRHNQHQRSNQDTCISDCSNHRHTGQCNQLRWCRTAHALLSLLLLLLLFWWWWWWLLLLTESLLVLFSLLSQEQDGGSSQYSHYSNYTG